MSRRQSKTFRRASCVFVLAIPCAFSTAQDTLTLSQNSVSLPTAGCRSGLWSSSRELDSTEQLAQLDCTVNWYPKIAQGVRLGLNSRAFATQDSRHSREQGIALREGFLAADRADWSFILGRQIIAWGRTDRIGPTDFFSRRDLTALVADDDEQRVGVDALRIKRHFGQATVLSLVTAKYSANRTPIPQGLPALPALDLPHRPEYALKIDSNAGNLDWSVSVFDGFDRTATYRLQTNGAAVPSLQRHLGANQTLGADIATSLGDWVVRAEGAYTKSTHSCALCAAPKTRSGKLVLGLEREIAASNHLAIQVYGLYRSHYEAPHSASAPIVKTLQNIDRLNSEFGAHEYGATWKWTIKAMNDALRLEFAGVLHAPSRQSSSLALRPRIRYAITDRLHVAAGWDRFIGSAQTYFGTRRPNNLVFLELGYTF
jgi:hypothetical protein